MAAQVAVSYGVHHNNNYYGLRNERLIAVLRSLRFIAVFSALSSCKSEKEKLQKDNLLQATAVSVGSTIMRRWLVVIIKNALLFLCVGLCNAQGRLPWLTNNDEAVLSELFYNTTNRKLLLDLWSEIMQAGDRSNMAATTREENSLGRELVFGEVTAKGVQRLLDVMDLMAPDEENPAHSSKNKDVFLDLGSGTAIALLLVASILPDVKVIGVEYALARHEVAMERLQLLDTFMEPIENRVQLLNGNFLDPSFVPSYQDVTVVFSNSIMFSEETEQGIKKLISNHMPNVRFVVSGIKFHDRCYKQHLDVTWGSDTFSLWACDMETVLPGS